MDGLTVLEEDWPLAGHSIEPRTDDSDRELNKRTDQVWTSQEVALTYLRHLRLLMTSRQYRHHVLMEAKGEHSVFGALTQQQAE